MGRAPRLQRIMASATEHQQAGRYAEAETCYRRVLADQPANVAALNNLALVQQALGRLQEATANYRRAIAIAPRDARLRVNLGNVLFDQQMDAEAIAAYRHALLLRPDMAEVHNNLGGLLHRSGDLRGSAECYQQAIAINPSFAEAQGNLARIRLAQGPGYGSAALDAARRYLALRPGQDAQKLFARCIQNAWPRRATGDLRTLVQQALIEAWDRPLNLSAVAAHLICVDLAERSADDDRLLALAKDELLLTLLVTGIIPNATLEGHLTDARRKLLDHAMSDLHDAAMLPLACALAQQCFFNEYVFAVGDVERRTIAALRSAGDLTPLRLATLACYEPLHLRPDADDLLQQRWPDAMRPVLRQQIEEPRTEQRLRAMIPALSVIDDPVSRSVRHQYEANPYPRWLQPEPAEAPLAIDAFLQSRFPFAPYAPLGTREPLDVLIAGCGTGQQPIEVARQFAGAQVLAVDLSLASLAYAQRRAHELGTTNVAFAQADILHLGDLAQRFDVIQSTGVLHHLADPFSGWRVLRGLLRPGGVMQIGLYSRLGRQAITAARDALTERGIPHDPETIRLCRQELLASTDELLRQVTFARDFYALSTCRDLLFHVQETLLTLPKIATFLTEQHLTFLGFEIDQSLTTRFLAENPDKASLADLATWHAFEERHPETFFGMYQFWVQSRFE
jgi:SAM-dependent methyltransferase/tetratricopeptide (TPR) repeat protein